MQQLRSELAINSQQGNLLDLSNPIVEFLRHLAEAVSHYEAWTASQLVKFLFDCQALGPFCK